MSDHNVIPIRGQQEKAPGCRDDAPDLMDRWMVAQHVVDAVACSQLTNAEAMLLSAVNRLSAGYGKDFCLKSRAEVARTAGMSIATYERVVPRLVRRGVLIREATFHYNRLSIDREVLKAMLNVSKRVRQNEGDPLPQNEGPPSLKMREPIEENTREEKPREENPSVGGKVAAPPTEPSVRERAKTAMEDSRRRRSVEEENARKHSACWALEVTWRAAWFKTFPRGSEESPSVWTGMERGRMKGLARNWTRSEREDLHDFLEWVVDHWRVVTATDFAWMRREPPPRYPDVVFLSQHLHRFIRLFGQWRSGRRWEDAAMPDISGLPREDRLKYLEGLAEEARERRRQRRRDR